VQGVHKRILLSVKFKRKRENLLSLSELTKLRKDIEIEVSKGKVPLYGIRTNEMCSGRAKVCIDCWIWERARDLTPWVLRTSRIQKIERVHRKGGKTLEVPKLIWALDLRIIKNHPNRQNYEVVNLTLTNSGRFQLRGESTSLSPKVPNSILVGCAKRHMAPNPSLQRFSALEENGLC